MAFIPEPLPIAVSARRRRAENFRYFRALGWSVAWAWRTALKIEPKYGEG